VNVEQLILLIVRTVVEELGRQGLLHSETPSSTGPPLATSASSATAPLSASLTVERRVVSAQTVLDAVRAGYSRIDVPPRAIVTPLAADLAKEKGMVIRRITER